MPVRLKEVRTITWKNIKEYLTFLFYRSGILSSGFVLDLVICLFLQDLQFPIKMRFWSAYTYVLKYIYLLFVFMMLIACTDIKGKTSTKNQLHAADKE